MNNWTMRLAAIAQNAGILSDHVRLRQRYRHSLDFASQASNTGSITVACPRFLPHIRCARSELTSALEVLRRGPDHDLVDFHVGWLLDGVSDCACDRVGRNSHFHELAQILSSCLLRAALRELRRN